MPRAAQRSPLEIQQLLIQRAEETKGVLNRVVESDEFPDIDIRILTSIFYEACHHNPCAQHIVGNLCERCGELELAEGWFELAAEQDYAPSRKRLDETYPAAA